MQPLPSSQTVCAVVVTYNRLSQLQISLPLLLAEAVDLVLVVDNASSDGTAAWLETQDHPKLTVLRLPTNSGGAGGFEAGMRQLTQAPTAPDWILLLDDDAWPASQAIEKFKVMLSDLPDKTGAVAAAVYLPNGDIAEMNRPGYNPFWHFQKILTTLRRGNRAGFKLPNESYSGDILQIDNASFVGYFIAKPAWKTIGLPEAGLFIYGDDVLYSLRLRKAGWKLIFAPQVRFTHNCGSMDEHFVYRPLWKIYYHCRNGVTIAKEAAGPVIFPLALIWYLMIWGKRGLRCQGIDRIQYYKMMARGVWDGLLMRRGRLDHLHHAPPSSQKNEAILPKTH